MTYIRNIPKDYNILVDLLIHELEARKPEIQAASIELTKTKSKILRF